jgi:hypothetical protein
MGKTKPSAWYASFKNGNFPGSEKYSLALVLVSESLIHAEIVRSMNHCGQISRSFFFLID